MKTLLILLLPLLVGCSINQQPSFNTKNDTHKRVVITEEILEQPSGNIIRKKTTETVETDKSSSLPVYQEVPEPTFFQKVRTFVLKYSLILGIIAFLCPSLAVLILRILYNRSRYALKQVVRGVEEFKNDKENNHIHHHLSKSLDEGSKSIIKKLKE